MADQLNLALRVRALVDGAQDVDELAQSLEDLIQEVSQAPTQGLFDSIGIRSAQQIQEEINRINNSLIQMANSSRVSGTEYRRAFEAGTQRIRELEAEMNGVSLATGQATLATKALSLAMTAIPLLGLAQVVSGFFSVNASAESLEASLRAVAGSAEGAAEMMAFIRSEADRMGIRVDAAGQSFKTLAAATKGTNLEGQATREIWSAVAGAMTQLGATSDDVNGAMTQLAQGASKGKFELEDLKSIAERIPGFFNKFADALGVTTQEFFAMVSAGQITADKLPALAKVLSEGAEAATTFNANMARLVNALSSLGTAIGSTGVFDLISGAIAKMAQTLNFAVASAKLFSNALSFDSKGVHEANKELQRTGDALFGVATKAAEAGKAGSEAGEAIANGMGKAAAATEKASETMGLVKKRASDVSAAWKGLGVDLEQFKSGLSSAEKAAVQMFTTIASTGTKNGQALLAGFLSAVEQTGEAGLGPLVSTWERLRAQQRITNDEAEAGLSAVDHKLGLLVDTTSRAVDETAKWQEVLSRPVKVDAPATVTYVREIEQDWQALSATISQFTTELAASGDAAASYINDMRAQFTGLSSAAGEYFEKVALHTSGFQGAEIGRFYEDMAKHLAMVQNAFIDQTYTLEDLKDRLDSATASAADMTAAEQFLADQASDLVDIHHLLGEEQLEPLREALEDARWRMQALRDEAADTLSSISDEWDRLNNNLDAIEARRGAAREADLKARLEAARATGDQQAIADLEKSLKLLKEITKARIEDAKEREKQTAATRGGDTDARPTSKPDTAGGVIQPRSSNNSVTINIGGVLDVNDKTTLDTLGRKLAPVIDNLQRLTK